jgi:hypothetical protein
MWEFYGKLQFPKEFCFYLVQFFSVDFGTIPSTKHLPFIRKKNSSRELSTLELITQICIVGFV